jgi:hypothetical protein
VSHFRWISVRKTDEHIVRLACVALGVSPSAHDEWCEKHEPRPSPCDLDKAYLANEIRMVHNNIDDSHGSPCLINELNLRQ